ncbi:MAG: hypothetical protein J5685_06345 [Clostridiales bacterium]|nr:hypothetical protein [Clostridiales bacterium]
MRMPTDLKQFNIAYLRYRIDSLPEGKIREYVINGKRSLAIYISEFSSEPGYRRKKYIINSKTGKRLVSLVRMREKLQDLLASLERSDDLLGDIDFENYRDPKKDEYWDQIKAVEDTNTKWSKPLNGPHYNGLVFRSKSEMIIAVTLDDMGIEYAYEPTVYIGGRKFNPDFAVYIRAIGKVFFIEHLGRMSSLSYRKENFDKICTYMESGMKIGSELLLFYETEDSGISPDVFIQQISAMIMANICEAIRS